MLSDDGAKDTQEVWVLGEAGGSGGKGGGCTDCEGGDVSFGGDRCGVGEVLMCGVDWGSARF